LQTSFGVNTLALVGGEPVTLSLRRALVVYIEHRFEVLTRRTQFQLAKARERAHILEGLRIALEFLDEVIAVIRHSDSADAARTALMERFGLSQVQAQAILDLQLRRLAALERQKIEDEYQEILARIAHYLDLLDNPDKLRGLIRADIVMLKEKFGDPRRSTIVGEASGDFSEEDLIAQDNVLISYSAGAYIKRMSSDAFRAQNRGGRGIKGMSRAAKMKSPTCSLRARSTISCFSPTRGASTPAASTSCPKAAAPRAGCTSPTCSTYSPMRS
jgi:DNA gyrase subunit A